MKKEIRENNKARRLLTDEELEQVTGGVTPDGGAVVVSDATKAASIVKPEGSTTVFYTLSE